MNLLLPETMKKMHFCDRHPPDIGGWRRLLTILLA
jgi:hypothetical protein